MNLSGKAVLLRIVVAESDTVHGKPLYEQIVKKARELNLAGATVTRGIMGYGGSSRIHTAKVMRLSEDLPVTIEIVDEQDDLERLMPYLEENLTDGLACIIPCDVKLYRYKQ